jgi:hypothetical protein
MIYLPKMNDFPPLTETRKTYFCHRVPSLRRSRRISNNNFYQ